MCHHLGASFDLRKLCKHSSYNPYQPKLHAKVLDGAQGQEGLQRRELQVCMEKSEKL